MAIIIPSKNIYDLQNQKIKSNFIDKIEIESDNITVVKDFDKVAYSEIVNTENSFDGISISTETEILPLFDGFTDLSSFSYYSIYYYVYAVACGSRPFYKTIDFSIPRNENNKYIEEIFSGIGKDGENNIKSSVTYNYTEHYITTTASLEENASSGSGESNTRYYLSSVKTGVVEFVEKEQRTSDLPSPSIETTYKWAESENGKLTASVKLINEENLSYATISYDKESDTYNCSIKILCGLLQFSHILGRKGQSGSYPSFIKQENTIYDNDGNATGILKIYEPLNVQISFYGNVISLDIQKEKIVVSEGDKKPFSISNNELLQKTNYGISISDSFSKTLGEYKNGKETATILCSISDYYNEDGIKEISIDYSTTKMSFEVGDTVIPMVFGADGKDNPMSRYKDGSPKLFTVLGTKKIYDGAVWQELTLQEKAYKGG